MSTTGSKICTLALEDGTIAIGESAGASGTAVGEVVFNTALTGYQEILTDPSYCGQIVTMTYPQIGNYGVNAEDVESKKIYLSGFVMRECARRYSNYRASGGLEEYLAARGVVAIAGVDTRAITGRLRVSGALRGVISTEISDAAKLVEMARAAAPMTGSDLVQKVSPHSDREMASTAGPEFRVVAIDCGIKENILRSIAAIGGTLTVVPGSASAAEILAHNPHGVLAGNGPGDPAAVRETIETLRGLVGQVPIFGICLGHQMLALALGAETYKLKFGHHGANHPVLNHATGRVEITSQNHGFAVHAESLARAGLRATHTNLYDGSLEGYAHESQPLFSVQYHPEAAPGPHDSTYLFRCFAEMMRTRKPISDATFGAHQSEPEASAPGVLR